MGDLEIRVMKEDDVENVLRLIVTVWGYRLLEDAEKDLRAMFHYSSTAPAYTLAVSDGEVVGLCGHGPTLRDWNVQAVFWVTVAPERQRQGIGSLLMGRVIQDIRSDESARAIELTTQSPEYFKRHGFSASYQFLGSDPEDPRPYHVMFLKINTGE